MENQIFENLLQSILEYREEDITMNNVYNFKESFANLPAACLGLEILGQIIESGFVSDNNPDHNLYRDKLNGDELFKIKEICERLVQDESLVIKAMNNDFLTFLCSKNVSLDLRILEIFRFMNSSKMASELNLELLLASIDSF